MDFDLSNLMFGDCIESMRTMPDNSVDSIVTDPPYELGFMGKKWDSSGIANSVEMWTEALRVLKPGGHLLAFSGSRTYHRMVCAIEDAGFEIRDQIMWIYSSGFPKSMNLDRLRGKEICGCSEGAVPAAKCDVRPVRRVNVPATKPVGEELGEVLQSGLPQQGVSAAGRTEFSAPEDGLGQPGMEGWGDVPTSTGQLRAGPVCASASLGAADGAQGRLRDGAPAGDGADVRVPADPDGGGPPCGPHAAQQCERQPGALAGQQEPQAVGAWPVCGRCGLPVVPQGLGTALKPAHEPIVVARKPLVGTVAANVLEHGTGALNIDACRVPTEESTARQCNAAGYGLMHGDRPRGTEGATHGGHDAGRWPANIIHDGSDEVLAGFPETKSGGYPPEGGQRSQVSTYGKPTARGEQKFTSSEGSAARFFYCAKASRSDRNAGLVDPGPQFKRGTTLRQVENTETAGNTHPTVKPTDLMAYLVRLVTPPGGLVLDPFMGSGSTGKAAVREGFAFIGIEMSAEYLDIARARICAAAGIPVPDHSATCADLF